jgi:hypothetical protein
MCADERGEGESDENELCSELHVWFGCFISSGDFTSEVRFRVGFGRLWAAAAEEIAVDRPAMLFHRRFSTSFILMLRTPFQTLQHLRLVEVVLQVQAGGTR